MPSIRFTAITRCQADRGRCSLVEGAGPVGEAVGPHPPCSWTDAAPGPAPSTEGLGTGHSPVSVADVRPIPITVCP